AASLLHTAATASAIYVRAQQPHVIDVQRALARTVDPAHPEDVEVSRPSDALAARSATNATFTSLLLGLSAVALLVGGVGIANVMVVAVLERRTEIGLRRALGATRRHVALQFVGEALAIALVGGTMGAVVGAVITGAYAASQGWPVAVPLLALVGGVVVAAAVGGVAGLYPAARAARMTPTDALRA
ncbi:MAG: ABC transporter permease, partial [Acidimicrobiia bacterium]|nr:ABC transporter permease [Acidimicrobiia bacterium]